MRKFLIPLMIFFTLAGSLAAGAAAAAEQSTGWVSSHDALRISRQLKSEGMLPVKIECKGDSRSSFISDSIMLDVTFAPNTEHRPWKWRWGTNLDRYAHNLSPKGWKLVSKSGFTRPKTGLFVPCGVFVGPPGASAEFGPLSQ
jgi:hypothetical protein